MKSVCTLRLWMANYEFRDFNLRGSSRTSQRDFWRIQFFFEIENFDKTFRLFAPCAHSPQLKSGVRRRHFTEVNTALLEMSRSRRLSRKLRSPLPPGALRLSTVSKQRVLLSLSFSFSLSPRVKRFVRQCIDVINKLFVSYLVYRLAHKCRGLLNMFIYKIHKIIHKSTSF